MSSLPNNGVYFEDIAPGDECWSSIFELEREAMLDFARQWDPLPIHLDDAEARKAGFDGQTASGSFLLAVKNRLLHDFGLEHSVIASFGFDEVRFKEPGRPGDRVRLRLEWVEKRPSRSRPDRGIARHHTELSREDGTVLLSLYDTVLVATRSSA